ncbi:MAG: DUF3124 domain-containing protein [Bacteroidota bacterium]
MLTSFSLWSARLSAAALLLVLPACVQPDAEPSASPDPTSAPPTTPEAADLESPAAIAQTVYVPAYSHIFFQDERRDIDLTTTLSIRNTDPETPITITSIQYIDSDGTFVRSYGETPLTLPPLASRPYVVEEDDLTEGVGANFLVNWQAAVPVSLPVIETVMISTAQSLGISFVSRGVAIRPLDDVPAPDLP